MGETPWRFKSSHPHSHFWRFRGPFVAQTLREAVLELSDGTLVPFVRDAVRAVGGEQIEINEDFLG